MFSWWCSRTHDWVNLIEEYRARLVISSYFKKESDQLFRVSSPLAYYSWCWHVKESGSASSGYCFRQHSFTCSWRSEQQNTFPRFKNALEEMRILKRHKDSFFQKSFGFIQSDYIMKSYIGIFNDNFPLNSHCQFFKFRVPCIIR